MGILKKEKEGNIISMYGRNVNENENENGYKCEEIMLVKN